MMNRIWMFCCIFALSACVVKPPVQEMAEARSAIEMAQEIVGLNADSTGHLKSAEDALQEASDAIEHKQYNHARLKAKEAKKQAQQAARASQNTQ